MHIMVLQVVVLKSGDLTEDQAKNFEKEAAVKPREVGNEKIVFKKPTKKEESEPSSDNKKSKDKKKSNSKKVKNSSLLSFNEEEDS